MNIIKAWFTKPCTKKRVLIFGTGAGGSNLHKRLQHEKKIIGFLDNSIDKQNHFFCQKKVYPPKSLSTLNYDEIIIASDYYQEIRQQLTHDLNIPKEVISVFSNTSNKIAATKYQPINAINSLIKNLICHNNSRISTFSYIVFCQLFSFFDGCKIRKIRWLDTLTEYKIQTFSKQTTSNSYGPKYTAKQQLVSSVQRPEIALYKFTEAQLIANCGSILLPNNEVVITRVPSASIKKSDYASGFLVYHQERHALVNIVTPLKISKGIAITGANDLNYYHWVLETISKIQYLESISSDYKDYPLLISIQLNNIESIKTLFNCLSINRTLIFLESNITYQVESLLYISPPNYFVANLKGDYNFDPTCNYFSEDSLKFIRQSALNNIPKPDIKTHQRIFLARKGNIRNYNQPEVEKLVSKYSFTTIYLEDLSFAEQIATINSAQYIIGPTGAAWTNLLFAKNKAKALTWIAKEAGDFSCFSSIAKYVDIQLDFLTYSAHANNSRAIYFSPYKIDCYQIEKWLIKNIKESTKLAGQL